jgi:hypothetical protein
VLEPLAALLADRHFGLRAAVPVGHLLLELTYVKTIERPD